MKKEEKIYQGRFQGSGKGFGFFIPEEGEGRKDDCFVPPRHTGGAWDGDRVEVSPMPADPFRPERRSVRVVKVLERGNKRVTGTIRRLGREVWLTPDNDRLPAAIKLTGRVSVREGEKAAVAVNSYGSEHTPPLGTLRETFGPAGTREAAVEAILYQQDICRDFPKEVEAEAAGVPQKVSPAAHKGRLDLRDRLIITIDGASAKDLDDAVSLEKEGESWVLGVHIADVSSYVKAGSPLDVEAYERGTSVYFADQVVPMLPPALSNGICSLNPQVDRLTLSCFMTIGKGGQVEDHSIAKTVIRTTERMTYADCNTLLEGSDPALAEKYAHILPMLGDMAELAKTLEKGRKARGSLDLESSESDILCDEEGRPVEVVSRKSGVSEGIIESFMLIANETVARHLHGLKRPAVYRVHEKPSTEKTENLRAMLSPLGYDLREGDSFALQKVLEAAKDKPEAAAVSMMVLRSMMKARYDTENLGHFGLAAPYYCHFTSPIRRYPDLMVHRSLHALLDGKEDKKLAKSCQRAAEQSSRRELAAQTAERDIEKLYFAEYMTGHIGERFMGLVSGTSRFGVFVALASGVEGLVPLEALPDDHYVYDETHMTLTGSRTGQSYGFGQPLEVVCVAADPGTGRVDFRLPGVEGRMDLVEKLDVTTKNRRRGKAPKGKGNRPAMHVPKGRRGRRR